jgi:hypothetical protein
MADQDELRLRIVPELDQQAKKQVEDDLSTISGNIPIGGKGKGSDPAAAQRKQELADIRARIGLIDLAARKDELARQRRIEGIQKDMALNRLSMQQGTSLIAQQEQARENNSQAAIQAIRLETEAAESLNLTLAERNSIQGKAFFATTRIEDSFTTMSRSMTGLQSNTKSANIAVANFARIIQDLPFGILGISNNIDPMLNSFADVKTTAGGATGALKQMLAVLRGPLGLIFLLGSALPTAALFAQKAFDKKKRATVDVKKSTDDYIGALKSAASSQISELIPSTLSYAKQVELLESAIRGLNTSTIRQNDVNETLVSNVRGPLLNAVQSLSIEYGKFNIAQVDATGLMVADIDVVQAALVAKENQKQAVKEIIEAKLNEVRATQAISDALKNLGLQRQKSTEEIKEEQRAQEDYDAYLARRGATRVIEGETPLMRVAREERERLKKLRQEQADEAVRDATSVGEGELKVTRATLGANLELYQTSEDMVGEVMSSGAMFRAQLLENEQQGLIDMMDLSTSLARTAFGDTKGVAIAEALVNTYVGVSRAFREYTPPLSGVIAGLQLANGLAQVNKIKNTKIGDKGGSASTSSASISTPSRSFVNDLGAAGQVAGTIGPFGASMTPNISITANLDRQGLALAVRDGESDIATRQIPFAS